MLDHVIEVLAMLTAVVALGFSLYTFSHTQRRRRRKLVSAVYYHAGLAVETLEGHLKNRKTIRENIEKDESYMPYVVRSPVDDLTYDQVIEVMEWLNREEEETVSLYFHHQSGLHAIAQSFDLEFIRNWPVDRRLRLWDKFEEYLEETLEHARRTRDILDDKRV